MSEADYHYRDHVIPRLHRLAALYAGPVGAGLLAYSYALDALCQEAWRLGAGILTDPHGLEEYLAILLADLAMEESLTKGN